MFGFLEEISDATLWPTLSCMSHITMCTPCAAKTSAVVLPIPEAHPVIRTRLPAIEGIMWQAVSSRGQSPWGVLGHILIGIIGDDEIA